MAKILYIRVSSAGQNIFRQELGKEFYEKVFVDRCSGKNTDRPELKKMLDYIREGDIVEVHSFDRLARSTKDLLELVDYFEEKKVKLISKKENLDTSTPNGKLMLTMLGAIAEFERAMINERRKEGTEIAKKKGVKFGRPEIKITEEIESVFQEYKIRNISAKKAIEQTGLKKATFYSKFNEWNEKTKE